MYIFDVQDNYQYKDTIILKKYIYIYEDTIVGDLLVLNVAYITTWLSVYSHSCFLIVCLEFRTHCKRPN